MALSDLGTIASIATALAVVLALFFGVIQVRQQARHSANLAAMDMLHAIQTPEYIYAWATVSLLPDAAPARTVAADPQTLRDALVTATTLETLALAIDRRIVLYELWRDTEGGVTRFAWVKLSRWMGSVRKNTGLGGYARFEALALRLSRDPSSSRPADSASTTLRDAR